MIAFQKTITAPTTEASKEMVVNAESSARTKALIERFRQTGEEQHKRNLASVCYMATFGESQNAKGVKDLWRKQETAHLNGLVVTDFDHVEENLLTLHARWQTMLDFKKEGILKVFVTPSGKGIKVVSKWRKEWGNLAQNQFQLARMLDMERYLDTSGKDASRAAFVPMHSEVLYEDDEVYTYFNPECDEVWGEVYRNVSSPLPTSPEGEGLEAPSLPPPVGEELRLGLRLRLNKSHVEWLLFKPLDGVFVFDVFDGFFLAVAAGNELEGGFLAEVLELLAGLPVDFHCFDVGGVEFLCRLGAFGGEFHAEGAQVAQLHSVACQELLAQTTDCVGEYALYGALREG
jgi:hypothetical protein